MSPFPGGDAPSGCRLRYAHVRRYGSSANYRFHSAGVRLRPAVSHAARDHASRSRGSDRTGSPPTTTAVPSGWIVPPTASIGPPNSRRPSRSHRRAAPRCLATTSVGSGPTRHSPAQGGPDPDSADTASQSTAVGPAARAGHLLDSVQRRKTGVVRRRCLSCSTARQICRPRPDKTLKCLETSQVRVRRGVKASRWFPLCTPTTLTPFDVPTP